MEGFWSVIAGGAHQQRPGPHHPSFSLMDVQKDFGENERNKDNQHGVELALFVFARQPIDPTHLMINRWCC
jgi:hypothetical protein